MSDLDIAIIGGGAAGIAAAISAAKTGASVMLIEKCGSLGGMATQARVGTICGLYYRNSAQATFCQNGFAKEFAEKLALRSNTTALLHEPGLWFLPYDPLDFALLAQELMEEAKVEMLLHTNLVSVTTQKDEITALSVSGWRDSCKLNPKYIIDCSGDSIVSRLAGNTLLKSEQEQAAAFVFELTIDTQHTERTVSAIIIRELLAKEQFLGELSHISVVPGSLRAGKIALKIALPQFTGSDESFSITERVARNKMHMIAEVLKELPEFSRMKIINVANSIGVRGSLRAEGEYILSAQDVLEAKQFKDGVALGSWPIELWENGRAPKMEYFSENSCYQIPYRALISKDSKNLFFAGKGISAEVTAIASARVIGTCMSTGVAAGKIAGYLCRKKSRPEAISLVQSEVFSDQI